MKMGNLTFGAWMMAPRLKMILGCAGVPQHFHCDSNPGFSMVGLGAS